MSKQAPQAAAPAVAPAAAPVAAPTSTPSAPAAVAPPPAPPNVEQSYDEAADDAAALAVLKAHVSSTPGQPQTADAPLTEEQIMEQAGTAGSAPTGASPEGQPPTPPAGPTDPWAQLRAFAEPEQTPQEQLPAEDARLMRLLQQVQNQERELVARRGLEGLTQDEVAEAKRLLAAKRAAKTDPEVWFREAGWDKATIESYIASGGVAPLQPIQAEFEAKTSKLQQQIEQLQGLIQAQQEQAAIQTFKGVIPQHLKTNEDVYPHLTTYYENPIDQMEAVWNVIHHARTVDKRSLTVAEAAGRLEKVLAQEAEKFAKVQSKKNRPATPTTPTKPQTPTLTNATAGGNGTPSHEEDDWEALDKRATQLYLDSLKKVASPQA
jgi:hypothetical protein